MSVLAMDAEAVLVAATLISGDHTMQCQFLPPCQGCDDHCDCLRLAKLVLNIPKERDITAEYDAAQAALEVWGAEHFGT